MKAVILNSGTGSRMGEQTKTQPKCFTVIDNKGTSILGFQLETLVNCGISKVLITTGPFEEQIISFVRDHFPQIEVEFVNNPRYAETNYIYSLFLAREKINEDVLLMHGDLVYDPQELKSLVNSAEENTVLVHKTNPLPDKDFKARIENGLVVRVGIDFFGEDCRPLMPAYKLTYKTIVRWLKEMERFNTEGNDKVYAENALNEIPQELQIKPHYYDGFCMEIDTLEDLAIAKEALENLQ